MIRRFYDTSDPANTNPSLLPLDDGDAILMAQKLAADLSSGPLPARVTVVDNASPSRGSSRIGRC